MFKGNPEKNSTNVLSILLATVLVFICIPSIQVLAENNETTDPKYFEFDSDIGTITDYDSAGGVIVAIPSQINEVGVEVIGEWAFEDKDLTLIEIPEGVEVIGHGAFWDNDLTSIEIPDGVKVIRDRAFEDNNLTSVMIPKSVKVIKERAFSENDLTSIEIPEGVEYLSGFNSNALTSVEIPDGVEVIGEWAFEDNDLTSIEIGEGVEFANNSFDGNFKEIYEEHNKAAGEYIREDTDSDWYQHVKFPPKEDQEDVEVTDPGYFEFDSSTGTITGYNTYGGFSLVIPSQINGVDVKVIEDEVFGDSDFFSVEIPDGVEVIGESAFKENDLTSLEIPDSVEEIKDRAFAGNDLTSINIPAGVEYLSGFNTNDLTSIEIPDSVEEIGKWAFLGNDLTSIEIPDSVEEIGKWAFLGNDLTSLEIGDGVGIPSDTIEGNFKEIYEEHNKSKGVYVREDADSDWYKRE